MTTDKYLMGIDGGGSNLRIVIATSDLVQISSSHGSTVNPSIVGFETAQQLIRSKIQEGLTNANLTADQISGVGIGIAGADVNHAGEWLKRTIRHVIPNASLALSSDYEIALTGAIGERNGVLILAGTGSVAYGVRADGQSILLGGWGYLLGDEGSGYWLGMEAIKACIHDIEKRGQPTSLTDAILYNHHLNKRTDLLNWIYSETRIAEIAQFATIVLDHAKQGDAVALDIVQRGAKYLAVMVNAIYKHLDTNTLPIAFAGSLLTNENPLSNRLCKHLTLAERPIAKHSPIIGAVILARDHDHP